MKKLLLCIILLQSISMFSQDVLLGFKTGPNLLIQNSYINNKRYSSSEIGHDFIGSIGVTGDYYGLFYEQGLSVLKLNFDENLNGLEFKNRFTIVATQFSLVNRFKFGGNVKVIADLGFTFSSILSSSNEYNSDFLAKDFNSKSIDFEDQYSNSNLGIIYGLGIEAKSSESIYFSFTIRKHISPVKNVPKLDFDFHNFAALFSMNFNIKSIVKRPIKNNSEEISKPKNDSINKKSSPKNNIEEPYFR
jgi:hypothetical protein